jgi:predicted transcriptional regulator
MTTTRDTRDKTLQVRVRPAEYQKLQDLAARDDEPVSAVVRRAIRLYIEHEEGDQRAEHHGREGQA